MRCRFMLYFAQVVGLLFFLAGCSFSINSSAGLIRITDLETCAQEPVEERCVRATSSFLPNTTVVYASFYLEAPGTAELEFRWSRGDDTLAVFNRQVEAGHRYAWLATNPGATFSPGRYQLEILLRDKVMAEKTFLITPGPTP